MSSPQPDSNTQKTSDSAETPEASSHASASQSSAPRELEALSENASSPPPARQDAPAPQAAAAARRGTWSGWLLVLGLLVALLVTGGLLLSEKRKSAGLEGEVATLNSELSVAEEALATHEVRLGLIRDQVGDIFSRVGTLQGLVNSEGIPNMAAYALPSDHQSPTVVSEPQSQSLATEPLSAPPSLEIEPSAISPEAIAPGSDLQGLGFGEDPGYGVLEEELLF